jgi:hypothetical protein
MGLTKLDDPATSITQTVQKSFSGSLPFLKLVIQIRLRYRFWCGQDMPD